MRKMCLIFEVIRYPANHSAAMVESVGILATKTNAIVDLLTFYRLYDVI
jgi:hypothetical protein